ncbi:carbonic anhydrase [Kribbella deserti]|uniref:Carbonic anhydrase n=1 Tax=Kribbella deserti TaxID=1926257 RepID=A0ABV6QLY6_9ACTN
MEEPNTGSRRNFLRWSAGAAVGAGLLGTTLAAAAHGHAGEKSAHGPTAQGSVPAAEPAEMTSAAALQLLVEGNRRYAEFHSTDLNETPARRTEVVGGQHPFATIFSCVDSRVSPELVFDRGLGDLVVVRSAGEVPDHAVTGSLEFGVEELHTPVMLVLGHQKCGALAATIEAVKNGDEYENPKGDVDYLVRSLAPVVKSVRHKPGDLLTNAVKANVRYQLTRLRRSPLLGPAEREGKVMLVGGYYSLETGLVEILHR